MGPVLQKSLHFFLLADLANGVVSFPMNLPPATPQEPLWKGFIFQEMEALV